MLSRKNVNRTNRSIQQGEAKLSDEIDVYNSVQVAVEFEQLYERYKRTGYKMLAAMRREQEPST